MEEEKKIPKQKPNTSFNKWLPVIEKLREHDNGQVKMFDILSYIGEHDKGENMPKSNTVLNID